MKILFHDELGNEQNIFVCGGCNEAWTKPFCDTCNACRECCSHQDRDDEITLMMESSHDDRRHGI
jgi:hypothetical protein